MLTNKLNIHPVIAVWLANDTYDYVNDPNYFSATSMLMSTRQAVLSKRLGSAEVDISTLVATSRGSAIHTAIEQAWTDNLQANLNKLNGFLDLGTVSVNKDEPANTTVYLEKRSFREFEGFKIGGKFDMVFNGQLQDFKTTSTATYVSGSRDKDYILQCSIYAWLNRDIITEPTFNIHYIFNDWSMARTSESGYPQCPVITKTYELLSDEQVEDILRAKLSAIREYAEAPEEFIPMCTDEELWIRPGKYKYYADATKTRATKVFDNELEAMQFQASKGGKGIVKYVPGEAMRCKYCPCSSICSRAML